MMNQFITKMMLNSMNKLFLIMVKDQKARK